jgi:hypothetical protein
VVRIDAGQADMQLRRMDPGCADDVIVHGLDQRRMNDRAAVSTHRTGPKPCSQPSSRGEHAGLVGDVHDGTFRDLGAQRLARATSRAPCARSPGVEFPAIGEGLRQSQGRSRGPPPNNNCHAAIGHDGLPSILNAPVLAAGLRHASTAKPRTEFRCERLIAEGLVFSLKAGNKPSKRRLMTRRCRVRKMQA